MTKCGSAHKISQVAPGSIAEEFGIEPGDSLLLVNGQKVEDVFDYRFMIREEVLTIVIRKGKHSRNSLSWDFPMRNRRIGNWRSKKTPWRISAWSLRAV